MLDGALLGLRLGGALGEDDGAKHSWQKGPGGLEVNSGTEVEEHAEPVNMSPTCASAGNTLPQSQRFWLNNRAS